MRARTTISAGLRSDAETIAGRVGEIEFRADIPVGRLDVW